MALKKRQRRRVWIDTSSIFYTAFYGVWKTYCEEFDINRDEIEETYEVGWDTDFQQMFKRAFLHMVTTHVRNHLLYFRWEDVIFTKDCPRRDIWRMQLLPTYKGDRDAKKKKYSPYKGSTRGIMDYLYDILIPSLIEEHDCKYIEVPSAECDDIIGVAIQHIGDTHNLVMTCDHDYVQLRDLAIIVTPRGECLSERFTDAKRHLALKIFEGDKSDCIPSIFTRCGAKTAEKFYDNVEFRKQKIEQYPECMGQIKINRKLIDFQYVPDIIKGNIIAEWDKIKDVMP